MPERPAAVVVDSREASSVLGREVRSAADENMGRIVDVIVDQSGQMRAAIIDFGGFLGVGSRKIAVDWKALRFAPGQERNRVILEMAREQVRGRAGISGRQTDLRPERGGGRRTRSLHDREPREVTLAAKSSLGAVQARSEEPPPSKDRRALAIVPKPEPGDVPPHPSQRSLRGLDWFVFCVADIQTGFGPFLAVYLTTQKWTQTDIGLILSVSGLVALVGQMPGGWIVDAARSERFVAGVAIVAIAIAALTYASFPIFPAVLAAAALHAAASCVLGPAIAAISLGLVGHAAIGERLGRNARFASIGNGLAAAVMGAIGHFFSARAVFVITAHAARARIDGASPDQAARNRRRSARMAACRNPKSRCRTARFRVLLHKRPLLIFAGCIMLFHLANAAMLPLMGGVLTTRSSRMGDGPDRGLHRRAANHRRADFALGRTASADYGDAGPLLIIGFAALPIRAVLFATVTDPYLLVVVQILDGLTAAVFGVLVPLIIADLTRGTGRFNLGARHRRHHDRHRRRRQHDAWRLPDRSFRQPGRVSWSRCARRRRADGGAGLHAARRDPTANEAGLRFAASRAF